MLQFKKTASAIIPYLEKNEEYDPNYLEKNESTSRKYNQLLNDEKIKK
jgi:hypothetical protein